MTTMLKTRPPNRLWEDAHPRRGHAPAPARGRRLTLEERLNGAFAEARAATAECPMCGGAMSAPSAGAAAKCGDCGTEVS